MDSSLICEVRGHDPVNFDPTGGDPGMGGPVMLTRCSRCGRDLERSDMARLFNEYQSLMRVKQVTHDAEVKAYQQTIKHMKSDLRTWTTVAVMAILGIVLIGVCWWLIG